MFVLACPCSSQVGRQHELELASAELERAQERLMALEREKQELVQAAGKQASAAESSQQGELNLWNAGLMTLD